LDNVTHGILGPWSREEVEAVVADYLHMLTQELAGQIYNKTVHRKALQAHLGGRSNGSIERKHQNISAILIELGCPYITGYKPLSNYQGLLFEVVADRVESDTLFDRSAISAAEQPAVEPLAPDFHGILVDPPALVTNFEQRPRPYTVPTTGIHRDYIDREARNRSLGSAGEAFVLAYEQYRLHVAGKAQLGERVEHISKTRGDGLGFDVLSFEFDGRERFIEVKTTSFGKETPFFVSRNEVELSDAVSGQFHLYRVFEFRRGPKMFDLSGRVRDRCRLDPVSFIARFI
jgi:hypothetical protein